MSFLRQVALDETEFPPFIALRKNLGFIPNLFRAQTLWPEVIRAEADLVGATLTAESSLSRRQKEYIMLVCSAANLNTYCVTVHCEMARTLGFTDPDPDEVAYEYRETNIPEPDKALLDFALKLTRQPAQAGHDDVEDLRKRGFTDRQILEAVVMTSLTSFVNILASGLGAVPDTPQKLPAPVSE